MRKLVWLCVSSLCEVITKVHLKSGKTDTEAEWPVDELAKDFDHWKQRDAAERKGWDKMLLLLRKNYLAKRYTTKWKAKAGAPKAD